MPHRLPRELGLIFFRTFPSSTRGIVSATEGWAIRQASVANGFIVFCVARLIGGPSHKASEAAAGLGLLASIATAVWGYIHYKTMTTPDLPAPPPNDLDSFGLPRRPLNP